MRCGVDENGAVQVGPNGFVANRSETASTSPRAVPEHAAG
jgi:hypothetical protein